MKSRKIINLFAFIAVILIVCSLVLGYLSSAKVFNWNSQIKVWCDRIAYYLGLIVTITCAFLYTQSKRNNAYTIILVVAVILIIVFLFVL